MARVCIVRRTLGWFGVIKELLGDVTNEGEHQHTLYQMATSWANSFIGDTGERGFYVKVGDKTYHKRSGLLHTLATSLANLFIGEELTIQKFNNYLIINGSLLMISEFEWDKIVEGRVIVYLECDFRRGFG